MAKHINAIFVITAGNGSRLATVAASQTFPGKRLWSSVNPDPLSRLKNSTLAVVLLLFDFALIVSCCMFLCLGRAVFVACAKHNKT